MVTRIRPETTIDHEVIHALIARAFAPMPYADGDEQFLPARFRRGGVLALSLVAEHNGCVVGQLILTPAHAANDEPGWYALGPIAVDPAHQGQGIGAAMINAATDWLRDQGAAGCVLVGNPSYYERFGWRPFPHLAPPMFPPNFIRSWSLAKTNPTKLCAFTRSSLVPMMSDKLSEICAAKRVEVAQRKPRGLAHWPQPSPPRGFTDTLRAKASSGFALIAEIKRRPLPKA